MMHSQTIELRGPSHVLIEASIEALSDARTALRDVPIISAETPAHTQLFYSVGQHFLMLGGNLRHCTERLAHSADIELPPVDESTGKLLADPKDGVKPGLMTTLTGLRELAIEVGRDDLYLETAPSEEVDESTIQDKAAIVLRKFEAMDEFTARLPETLALAKVEQPESYRNFESDVRELQASLGPKVTLADRYQALRHTSAGRRLNWTAWGNAVLGIGGVGVLQIAERQSPGVGEAIRNIPAFGWLYSEILVLPYYKTGSAVLAIANSPIPQRLLLSLDHRKDRIQFRLRDEPLGLPPEYIENLSTES